MPSVLYPKKLKITLDAEKRVLSMSDSHVFNKGFTSTKSKVVNLPLKVILI